MLADIGTGMQIISDAIPEERREGEVVKCSLFVCIDTAVVVVCVEVTDSNVHSEPLLIERKIFANHPSEAVISVVTGISYIALRLGAPFAVMVFCVKPAAMDFPV